MEPAGWEWQEAQLERERMARDALDRCAAKGANAEDLKTLASAAGITNYKPPHADRNAALVG